MKTEPLQRSSFPEEVFVYEILKRLPVKTLYRFRAVSKRWLSIINSRPFIDSHFQHSKLNPTCLFGFYNKDTTTTQHPPTFFSTHTSSYNWPDRCYRLCSISSRGLICFYNDGDDTAVQIWNPSTGEHMEVNPPPHKLRKRYPFFLGFDPAVKKHKLLSFGKGENYVFTLSENNWWSKITSLPSADSSSNLTPMHMSNCCNIDGIVYYLARRSKIDDELVLGRFDVVSETFLEPIDFPGDLVRFPYFNSGIYVYRGMILLLNYDHIRNGFQMWVLEKRKYWSTQKFIPWSPPSSEYHNVGFIDGKGILIYSSELDANSEEAIFQLCSYDLEKSSGWTETTVPEILKKLAGSAKYEAWLYSYVETLESLN